MVRAEAEDDEVLGGEDVLRVLVVLVVAILAVVGVLLDELALLELDGIGRTGVAPRKSFALSEALAVFDVTLGAKGLEPAAAE